VGTAYTAGVLPNDRSQRKDIVTNVTLCIDSALTLEQYCDGRRSPEPYSESFFQSFEDAAMEKKKTLPKRFLVTALLILSGVAFASWGLILPGGKTASQDLPQVKNGTRSFQLVSKELRQFGEEFVVLEMKNVSRKGITAYSISASPNGRTDTDYNISGHVIAPGETEEIEIPRATVNAADSTDSRGEIRILAVVFEDGTSEGDPAITSWIRERRLGEKFQFRQIARLLRDGISALASTSSVNLTSLRASISSLPEATGDLNSAAFREGLRDAKKDELTLLERLEKTQLDTQTGAQNISSLRDGLNDILQQTRKWIVSSRDLQR
jgi:hypothetical protein